LTGGQFDNVILRFCINCVREPLHEDAVGIIRLRVFAGERLFLQLLNAVQGCIG